MKYEISPMAPTAIKTGENLIYVLPTENESNNFAHKRFFHWTFVICIEIEFSLNAFHFHISINHTKTSSISVVDNRNKAGT